MFTGHCVHNSRSDWVGLQYPRGLSRRLGLEIGSVAKNGHRIKFMTEQKHLPDVCPAEPVETDACPGMFCSVYILFEGQI